MLVIADSNPIHHIKRPYVTWAMMALCVVIFLIDPDYRFWGFIPGEMHSYLFGSPMPHGLTPDPTAVWVTAVSYMFLHGGWLHLAGNLLGIWIFGNNVEDSMGHWRFALFYLLCGIGGAVAEGIAGYDGFVPVVGASGALSGIMGAYLLLHPHARVLMLVGAKVPVLVPASLFVGLTVGLDFVLALSQGIYAHNIAVVAHLGGFLTGAALILVLRYRDVPLFQPATTYPEQAFGAWSRFVIDLSPRADANRTWRGRLIAAGKMVFFLVVITVVAELIFA